MFVQIFTLVTELVITYYLFPVILFNILYNNDRNEIVNVGYNMNNVFELFLTYKKGSNVINTNISLTDKNLKLFMIVHVLYSPGCNYTQHLLLFAVLLKKFYCPNFVICGFSSEVGAL